MWGLRFLCALCGKKTFRSETKVPNSLLERKIEKRPGKVRLRGRILFLTEDPELIGASWLVKTCPGHEEYREQFRKPARRHLQTPTKSPPPTTAFTSTRRWARSLISA